MRRSGNYCCSKTARQEPSTLYSRSRVQSCSRLRSVGEIRNREKRTVSSVRENPIQGGNTECCHPLVARRYCRILQYSVREVVYMRGMRPTAWASPAPPRNKTPRSTPIDLRSKYDGLPEQTPRQTLVKGTFRSAISGFPACAYDRFPSRTNVDIHTWCLPSAERRNFVLFLRCVLPVLFVGNCVCLKGSLSWSRCLNLPKTPCKFVFH